MESYTCPTCKTKQTVIGVVSKCTQEYDLSSNEWGDIEPEEALSAYCLNCGENLSEIFKELKESHQI